MASKISQKEIVRKAIIKDLYDIDKRASNGFEYDIKKAHSLAMQILPAWQLGIIGRFKSGMYWIGKKLIIIKSLNNFLENKWGLSIIHSALAHIKEEEIKSYQDRNSSGIRSMASFAFEAAGIGKKKH